MGVLIICIVLLTYATVSLFDGERKKEIEIDDINVGDILKIKGERFKVLNYSDKGVMEIISEVSKTPFIFDAGSCKDIEFISHNIDGKRLYITLEGFKGTVGGDYLNKIKPI